ncbi:DNA replication protein psf1 [Coemansia nantahalensis]|uniref:DNA replication protein psf1 n=1 Tax=Coemansia helicoidea TaxID=1286919 RepID=A0ACC1L7H7_9FUNG|nr:DNA replication protein psf1 [Coemansia nantahalensis]KAJ2802990.1 DNA replication protein psf1 [Coemansia helicoidea]
MLGDEAFRLAKEAKDITASHIPSYNEEQVRLVTQETRYLWARIEEMIASAGSRGASQDPGAGLATDSQAFSQRFKAGGGGDVAMADGGETQAEAENTSGQTSLYMLTVGRNKRCLLAYHHRRLGFLRTLLWSLHLAPSLVPAELTQRLAPEEQNYAREYARLNATYRDAVEEQLCPADSLDWTASGEVPPRDLFVEVRVVRDCGEIVTENGVVNLQAGTQHYLRRPDVEHLLAIGFLEHVNPL